MSERLATQAELIKLARVLSVDRSELAYLECLLSDDLRAFRERFTNQIFDSGASHFRRVAAGAKLVPSGLAATIAQRSFGPLLCARASGQVDTKKAIDVAKRLPADFLADVTVELDPRRVAQIIAEVPADLVIPVAEELGRREEHVTMGRFLAFVPDHAIAAAIGVLSDEAMLRTAFVLEHKDRLDHAIGLLPPDRLPGLIRHATELKLWPEALDLLDHLSEERRGPIADVVADQDPEIVAGLVTAVHEAGIWDSLLPVVRTMSPAARVRLAAMPAFHDPDVVGDIIRAAAVQGLWIDLVPLIDALPPEVRETAGNAAAELEPELLTAVLAEVAAAPQTVPSLLRILTPELLAAIVRAVVDEPQTVPTLLRLAAEMTPEARKPVVAAIASADQGVAEALLAAIGDPEEMAEFVPLLTPDVVEALTEAAGRLGLTDMLDRVLAAGGMRPSD